MRNRFITAIAVAGLVLTACSGDTDTSADETAPDTTERREIVASEVTEPDADEPETTEPDTDEPDVAEPGPDEPDLAPDEPDPDEPAATEPEPQEADTDEPEVDAQEPAGHTLGFAGCEQVAMYLPVDVDRVDGRVGDDIELIVEDGRATALFMALRCGDSSVDGASAGASHVNVEWLSVAGPSEQRTIPEFGDAPVTPTQYWAPVLYQTDNPTLRQLAADAGLEMALVDEITFSHYADSVNVDGFYEGQAGTVTADGDEYSWSVPVWNESTVSATGQPVVFVHVAGDLELEALGHLRLSVPAGILMDADGGGEPIGHEPGEPGTAYLITYDELEITTIA